MFEIIIDTAIQEEIVLKQTIIILMFRNNADIIFLSIITNFNNMIIFLTIEILNEFIIIMIKLTVLKLTVKKQFIINQ